MKSIAISQSNYIPWKSYFDVRKPPFFDEVAGCLKPIYLEETFEIISELNRRMIEAICAYLSIDTTIPNSWDYKLLDGKNEQLAGICEQAGTNRHISGPAARSYMVLEAFRERKIAVDWYDYEGYSEYQQLWGSFEHGVSVLDVLYNCGADSRNYRRHLA